MIQDQGIGPFKTALDAACEELASVNSELKIQGEILDNLKSKKVNISQLIGELIRHVNEDEWPSNISDVLGHGRAIQLQLDIGTPAYAEMLKVVFSMPHMHWTAEEVESVLESRGCKVRRKFISNTFARLAAKGAVKKLSRGQYVVDEGREIEISDHSVLIKARKSF